jgi:hypothetical protein
VNSGYIAGVWTTSYLLHEVISIYADHQGPDAGQYYACEEFEAAFIGLALKANLA